MEKQLESAAAEVLAGPHVSGLVCVDQQGLCLLAQGEASPAIACNVASLASSAQSLEPGGNNGTPPKVVVNYSGMDLYVEAKPDVVVGLIRKTPQ